MDDSDDRDFLRYLRDREILSAAQVQRLERERAKGNPSLGRLLLSLHFMDEAAFLSHWAGMRNVSILSAKELNPSSEAVLLVPRETCVRFGVLPLRSEGGCLTVASSDPTNIVVQDELRFLTGLEVAWALASSGDIQSMILKQYPAESSPMEGLLEDDSTDNSSPVIREIEKMLTEALDQGASHIHLEPTQEAFILLFRMDGALEEVRRFPISLQAGMTARLKILGELDISERRMPQSGTLRLRLENHTADFAITTLPTAFYKERITLSVLDTGRPIPPPEQLGFDSDLSARLRDHLRAKEGLLVLGGPGSSGRTTTLYSLAASLAAQGRNVISVEERVGRVVPGITQVEPRAAASYPLAMAIRYAVRQDSEVLFLDPMGDAECLQQVLRAATGGRLVMASLGARSTGAAFERLLAMATDSYLLGGALRAVLMQSLVRTLCPKCKEPENISREVASKYGLTKTSLFKSKGCGACHGVGFRGRTLVGHLQEVDPALRYWMQGTRWQGPSGLAEGPFDREGVRRAILQKVESGTTSLLEALGHLEG